MVERTDKPILRDARTHPKKVCTEGQNNQKYRLKYWATRLSVCLFACTAHSFARTAHSFARSGLLALLAPSAALTRSLARSLPRSWDSEFFMSQIDLILSHSAMDALQHGSAFNLPLLRGKAPEFFLGPRFRRPSAPSWTSTESKEESPRLLPPPPPPEEEEGSIGRWPPPP